MVYFIRNTGDGSIKIGYSASPRTRLCQLQTASPHKLQLLGAIEGGFDREREIHAIFEEFRLGGEWFRGTPASMALVRLLGQVESLRRVADGLSDLTDEQLLEINSLRAAS